METLNNLNQKGEVVNSTATLGPQNLKSQDTGLDWCHTPYFICDSNSRLDKILAQCSNVENLQRITAEKCNSNMNTILRSLTVRTW